MKADRVTIVDDFLSMIRGLSVNVKLDLISKISDSLKVPSEETDDDSWKELFGSWQSDASAEEIIYMEEGAIYKEQ